MSKISSISASRFWGGRSLGWMVCLSDCRLRWFASSVRYRSTRRTTASTFSRGRPSPPRVSLLHMLSHPFSWLLLSGGLYPAMRCRPDATGEGVFFGGNEAFRISPGIGNYAQGVLVDLNEVEARGASGANAIRDRAGGRDDEPRA